MPIEKLINSIAYTLPILLISNILYIIFCAQFPGGEAGMAPLVLFKSSFYSFIVSIFVFFILSIKFNLNQIVSLILFSIISFLVLYFRYHVQFNDMIDLGMYLTILVSSIIYFMFKLIIPKEDEE